MAGSLEFIKSATGSSVSSLSVTDCFSDTYDVYFVSITKLNRSTAQYLRLKVIDSGGVDSTANYDLAALEMESSTSFAELKNTNQDQFTSLQYQGTGADDGAGLSMYVFNPFDSSSFTFFQSQSVGYYSSGLIGHKMIGVHTVAEQILGLQFFPTSGTFDLTVNVFGVK